jgi:hypothetical protein
MTVTVNLKGGTRTQKKYAKSMVEFCAKMLMPRVSNLEVNLHLYKFKKDDSYGYALATDDADADRPREFNVEINTDTRLRRILETIAHEMVHVKQFARGELYQSSKTAKHRWQGIWMRSEKEYWDLPWEIEAHGRECGLFVRWAEDMGFGNKAWTKDD